MSLGDEKELRRRYLIVGRAGPGIGTNPELCSLGVLCSMDRTSDIVNSGHVGCLESKSHMLVFCGRKVVKLSPLKSQSLGRCPAHCKGFPC